jgi:hypothetical protein
MNKTLIKICFVAALMMSAGSAYASGNLTGSTVIGGGTFSPSNKVNIAIVATTTDYAAQSKHSSGDRMIGTNNTDPKMYWTATAVGATATSPSSATVPYSSWTSL